MTDFIHYIHYVIIIWDYVDYIMLISYYLVEWELKYDIVEPIIGIFTNQMG